MATLIKERSAASVGAGKSCGPVRFEHVPLHVRDMRRFRRLPAPLRVQQAVAWFNRGEYDIPVLVSRGLRV